MSKKTAKRVIAGTPADPALPKTPVVIDGQTYNLCFDLGALAEAEIAINAELGREDPPRRVNLLLALPVTDMANTRILFAAAVRKFHPQISFDEALRMLRLDNVYDVATEIRKAYVQAMAGPEEVAADPPRPGE